MAKQENLSEATPALEETRGAEGSANTGPTTAASDKTTSPQKPQSETASDEAAPEGGNVLPRDKDWWKSAVVYQIYPRSFNDSDGDGIGDLQGIIERLDYLQDLGIDVIWLSPVYESPQVDNGYDISDYQQVDPLFGSLETMDRLLEEAHARDIRVVMDLVVNHTSDKHAWFEESRDPNSDKRDWYWWQPAKPGMEPGTPGAEPDGRLAQFAPSAWNYDPQSGEYCLGIFSAAQPDLNWENPEMRKAVYKMMRWWVDRGVDGFRMDVINLISKPEDLVGEPDEDGKSPSIAPFTRVANGPRLDEFLHEMNQEVGLTEDNLLTVGETPMVTIEVAKEITNPENDELNMVFTFEHMDLDQSGPRRWDVGPHSFAKLKQNLAKWQYGLEDAGWNSLYYNNHDQPRSISRFGDDSEEHRVNSAKTLATALHLHKGTPYIYQGEEFGMTNYPFQKFEEYEDIEGTNFYTQEIGAGVDEDEVLHSLLIKARDHARTPVQWNDSKYAGFTEGTPWFAVNPNYETINAESAANDPDSIFAHYQDLIRLRHEDEAVREGTFELLLPEDEQIWAVTRTLGDSQVVMVANCSSEPVEVPQEVMEALEGGEVLLGTHQGGSGVGAAPDEGTFAPWESRVVKRSV